MTKFTIKPIKLLPFPIYVTEDGKLKEPAGFTFNSRDYQINALCIEYCASMQSSIYSLDLYSHGMHLKSRRPIPRDRIHDIANEMLQERLIEYLEAALP